MTDKYSLLDEETVALEDTVEWAESKARKSEPNKFCMPCKHQGSCIYDKLAVVAFCDKRVECDPVLEGRAKKLQELIALWDSDIGDLDLPDFKRMVKLEKELQVCSYHWDKQGG